VACLFINTALPCTGLQVFKTLEYLLSSTRKRSSYLSSHSCPRRVFSHVRNSLVDSSYLRSKARPRLCFECVFNGLHTDVILSMGVLGILVYSIRAAYNCGSKFNLDAFAGGKKQLRIWYRTTLLS
jgi:hypothetical protein